MSRASRRASSQTTPGSVERGTFGATILGTFPLIISLAAIATILVFILPIPTDGTWGNWYRYVALVIGLLVSTLIGLAVAARIGKEYAAPASANPRVYGELRARWENLSTHLAAYCPPEAAPNIDPQTVRAQTAACSAAQAHARFIGTELGVLPREDGNPRQATGARWVLGTGFIDLWAHLHSAEEALFLVQPEAEVIGNGASDEMRLKDSGIDNSTDYLDKLRWGVATLDGGRYLSGSPPLPRIEPEDKTPDHRHRARVVLREVRRVIDEYRDARREGLVRSRNQLLWTGTVTGLAAYALLAIAVLTVPDGQAGREAIIAAAAFFLVGAVVGLFDQLRRGSGTETAPEEDYGVARARLLYIPLLSGLAAVGGVLVTAMLYGTLSDTIPPHDAAAATPGPTVVAAAVATPGPTAVPAAAATPPAEPAGVREFTPEVPSLERVFDLHENRFSLVIAAVFGLTPGLLVERLQNQATRYTSELQSTSAQSIRRT